MNGPSEFTFNDASGKCEKPACIDGFTFNAGTQQCERTTTTPATCPDGSAATNTTCEVTATTMWMPNVQPGTTGPPDSQGQCTRTTTTTVPATCPPGTTGPADANGRCSTPTNTPAIYPAPASGTATPTVIQGQCVIMIQKNATLQVIIIIAQIIQRVQTKHVETELQHVRQQQ